MQAAAVNVVEILTCPHTNVIETIPKRTSVPRAINSARCLVIPNGSFSRNIWIDGGIWSRKCEKELRDFSGFSMPQDFRKKTFWTITKAAEWTKKGKMNSQLQRQRWGRDQRCWWRTWRAARWRRPTLHWRHLPPLSLPACPQTPLSRRNHLPQEEQSLLAQVHHWVAGSCLGTRNHHQPMAPYHQCRVLVPGEVPLKLELDQSQRAWPRAARPRPALADLEV